MQLNATITIPASEVKKILEEYVKSLGYDATGVTFNLTEEGYRVGDTYKVFSSATVGIKVPAKG